MESYFYFFLKGLSTGITIAAIGGPVGILCVRKTIHEGLIAGIAIGFGAALADSLFGAIAAFGLIFISSFFIQYQHIISFIGGAFLLYLGARIILEQTQQPHLSSKQTKGFINNSLSSFFITLTNPATILFFTALAVSLGIGLGNYTAATIMISGVFLGSLIWFSSLALIVTIFHKTISIQRLLLLNKIFGLGLIAFGFIMIIKSFLFNA